MGQDRHLIESLVGKLPLGATERDRSAFVRRSLEALSRLEQNASELARLQTIDNILQEVSAEVAHREEEDRLAQKRKSLTGLGVSQIFGYLSRLKHKGELESDVSLFDLERELSPEVEEILLEELDGDESYDDVTELVGEIIDDLLE
ncbi:MAG: hypothetical protein L0338_28785 [Acidobacteria bacterium]|nr:hypothetical protein [Acidobacteriota bacterium]